MMTLSRGAGMVRIVQTNASADNLPIIALDINKVVKQIAVGEVPTRNSAAIRA